MLLAAALGSPSCTDKELDASGTNVLGEPCGAQTCDVGLVCEAASDSDAHVCAERIEIRGTVVDAVTQHALEGALVVAADELGSPVTSVVQTDAQGRYALVVSLARDPSGAPVQEQRWTLLVSATDHLPFPDALRPSLPIDAMELRADDDDPEVYGTIENTSTMVALVPRPEEASVTLTGRVEGSNPGGTLVVAEGPRPAPFAVADVDGAFTIFNVPSGAVTLRGYRRGIESTAVTLQVTDTDIAGIRLSPLTEQASSMSVVRGSVNIVDAGGATATSVVLMPSSVFQETLERGPVPPGLRAPAPPADPSISSTFEIDGVPAGRYHVLAAFENDQLVRDPDASIAGTQIEQIEVDAGIDVELMQSVKITGAVELIGPGADAPELVDASPTFVWLDDVSEDRYELVVRDALGDLIWHADDLPAVMGNAQVEVAYGGPALTSGMYYQFRVTSWRDNPQGSTAISRSEDLRGVFVVR